MTQLKRACENPSRDDGLRILVKRLWPRGLTRERAAVDPWLKEGAPSRSLKLPSRIKHAAVDPVVAGSGPVALAEVRQRSRVISRLCAFPIWHRLLSLFPSAFRRRWLGPSVSSWLL